MIHNRIKILKTNLEARFMWVKVLTRKDQAIFIAICYFPPKGAWYNMAGEASTVEKERHMGLLHTNLYRMT